jgi:hypothetical protein
MSDRDRDAEILAPRHQITVLERQRNGRGTGLLDGLLDQYRHAA